MASTFSGMLQASSFVEQHRSHSVGFILIHKLEDRQMLKLQVRVPLSLASL